MLRVFLLFFFFFDNENHGKKFNIFFYVVQLLSMLEWNDTHSRVKFNTVVGIHDAID